MFITFRLAGSLPQEAIYRLEAEMRGELKKIELLTDERKQKQAAYLAQKHLFRKWDAELDACRHGPSWLSQTAIASLICDALCYLDGKSYTLESYCVMPNHVHLVCSPLLQNGEAVPLSKIMQSLKGYTARKANILLGRHGNFWQHESYDHVIRDNAEFMRIVNYVLQNPARAGLSPKWVYSKV